MEPCLTAEKDVEMLVQQRGAYFICFGRMERSLQNQMEGALFAHEVKVLLTILGKNFHNFPKQLDIFTSTSPVMKLLSEFFASFAVTE